MRQIIHNLVRNGMEAMSPEGTVIIETLVEDGEVVLAFRTRAREFNQTILTNWVPPL